MDKKSVIIRDINRLDSISGSKYLMIDFSTLKFIEEILSSKRRKALPLVGAPGAWLTKTPLVAAYRNGDRQFECIEALDKEFGLEAVFTFMDLSLEAEAFGAEVLFTDNEAPKVLNSIVVDEAGIAALEVPESGTGRTAETLKCARLCANHFRNTPVFAGMIGPISLAGRIADMTEMLAMTAAEPGAAHALLAKSAAFLYEYIKALKAAGVNGVIIAEPAAGLLSPEACAEFSMDYIRRIIEPVQDDSFMVILHNCGRTEKQVEQLLSAGADALHVGNAVDITSILGQVPATMPVMGNIDPVAVMKTRDAETVGQATTELLEATRGYANFVLSSGCDIPFGVPAENIKAFFESCSKYNTAVDR